MQAQFAVKVAQVVTHLENASPAEVREELDRLTDDVLAQFAAAYQELISYVEEGMPAGAPARKATSPRKKGPPKDLKDPVFVRPTYVQQAFSAQGLRVAKAARPVLMEVLNDAIRDDIARIRAQLPTITKGEHEGEKKRVTVQPEDIPKIKLLPKSESGTSSAPVIGPAQDLGIISLGDDAPGHQIAVMLRPTGNREPKNMGLVI